MKRPPQKPRAKVGRKRKQRSTKRAIAPTPVSATPASADDEAWGADGLTFRQRAFVAAMVGPAGGNATKAAEMAGYAAENKNALRVTACENLTKPNIQAALALRLAARHGSPEWIRNSLIDIASSSLANVIYVGPDGETRIDFAKAAQAGALGQIREYREDVTGNDQIVLKRSIKIHDRRAALETLARLDGKLIDRHQVQWDLSALSDEELRRLRELSIKANAKPADTADADPH